MWGKCDDQAGKKYLTEFYEETHHFHHMNYE